MWYLCGILIFAFCSEFSEGLLLLGPPVVHISSYTFDLDRFLHIKLYEYVEIEDTKEWERTTETASKLIGNKSTGKLGFVTCVYVMQFKINK